MCDAFEVVCYQKTTAMFSFDYSESEYSGETDGGGMADG